MDEYAVRPIGRVESPLANRSAAPRQGLHRVQVLAIEGTRVRVRDLEALDGTSVVDIKLVLAPANER
jgi:tRNA (Thr-GGU) A37 N-methylase